MHKEIVSSLQDNQPVILKTETLYGLCANATADQAVEAIFKLKQIEQPRPLPVLVKDLGQLKNHTIEIPTLAQQWINAFWPGPLSIVLKAKNISTKIMGKNQTIAFRMSSSNIIMDLFQAIDFPIAATSANLTRQPNLLDPDLIQKTFPNVLMHNDGPIQKNQASTVVELLSKNTWIIHREGPITEKQLQEIAQKD